MKKDDWLSSHKMSNFLQHSATESTRDLTELEYDGNYIASYVLRVTTLQTEKIPDFSRQNCRQQIEQMHIY